MLIAIVLAVIVALTLAVVYVLVTTARTARAYDERRERHGIDATATITDVYVHTGGESESLRSLHLDLALAVGRRFEVTRTIELRALRSRRSATCSAFAVTPIDRATSVSSVGHSRTAERRASAVALRDAGRSGMGA